MKEKIVEFVVEGEAVGGLWLIDGEIVSEGYIPPRGVAVEIDCDKDKDRD